MPDHPRKTQVRSEGPTTINSRSSSYATSRSSSRTIPDVEHSSRKKKHHRADSHHSRESSYTSNTTVSSSSAASARSISTEATQPFEPDLIFMGHPPPTALTNRPFQPSVMLKLAEYPTKKLRLPSMGSLVASATLLQYIGNNRFVACSNTILQGRRPVDNIHELPSDYLSKLPRDLRKTALGYFSFPDIQVAKAGTYRLRVSLIQFPDSRSQSSECRTLTTVDSGTFRVLGDDEKMARDE